MATSPPRKQGDGPGRSAETSAWSALTWDDLEGWAGSRSVERGRSYQRGGRVSNLRIAADGALLATVQGTERYATTVTAPSGRGAATLDSSCTCPIGGNCKHAVAVVAEYLAALADGRDVPLAREDDPRWAALEDGGSEPEDWDDEDEDNWDDDEEDESDESEDEPPARARPAAPRKALAATRPADEDDQIRRFLRAKTQGELADLVWSLARRFPEVRREFREQVALQGGDVSKLLAEARREIRRATAEPGWRNSWTGEGHIPDFGKVRSRLARLLELGQADAVVRLGRDLIEEGMRLIGESNDEGETMSAFAECLPPVFEALGRSSLGGPERLLYAIDATMADDWDLIDEALGPVLDAATPEDWSAVADTLAGRLGELPSRGKGERDDFHRNYERDRLTGWIAEALSRSGREAEMGPLYEAEARATGSYERLVNYLIEARRFEEAERWAREGIAATAVTYSGIANHLAASLCRLARDRGRPDIVAGHAAHAFFEHPSRHTFGELMAAARAAGVEDSVRAAALRFLETGAAPYRLVSAPAAKPAADRRASGKKTTASAKRSGAGRAPGEEATPRRLQIGRDWPLPVPDELVPAMEAATRFERDGGPHLDVLLEMAIADRKPDEVLRWYDKWNATRKRDAYDYGAASYADRVAEAVAATHPERALEIYRAALDRQLPQAQMSAYESSVAYLKKLKPLYEALGRAGAWDVLVAAIREKYRNRPRFMELLDRLDGRPIVETTRAKRK